MTIERREVDTGIYQDVSIKSGLSDNESREELGLWNRLKADPRDRNARKRLKELDSIRARDIRAVLLQVGHRINGLNSMFWTMIDRLAQEFDRKRRQNLHEVQVAVADKKSMNPRPTLSPRERDFEDMKFRAYMVAESLSKDDFKQAVFNAFVLGCAYERYHVRPFEPFVKTGRKVKESARLGHRLVHGTSEQRQLEYAKMLSEVTAIRKRNPAISHTEACRRTAKKMGVSFNTVRNHVKKN